jgi:MFS family permease
MFDISGGRRRTLRHANDRAPPQDTPRRSPIATIPPHHLHHHRGGGGGRHRAFSNFSADDTSDPFAQAAAASNYLSDWWHEGEAFLQSLNPGGRLIEVTLLLVSFKACCVMWVIARRTKHADDDYANYDNSLRGGDDRARHELVYRRLRNLYLSVYACATFGDWIQGGFLYALYAEYGYSMHEIGLIFVVGYGSAATIGTYVSALGDTGGHRRNCVLYGVLYAGSCLLCNFNSLTALLVGRLLGGIAYSILYTSFESWLIAEADARGLPTSMLARLFSVATFTNAGSAVVAGMAGHLAVEVIPHTQHNKFASAFDVGVGVLILASVLAAFRWTERFGGDGSGSEANGSALQSLQRSVRAIRRSRALIYLGLVNSLYEAALYVFVFLWTPALERRALLSPAAGAPSHGLIFSIFMLSKMAGSQAFHALSARLSPSSILQLVFGGSACCLGFVVVTTSYERALLAFCGFEALLGMYWPAIALLRCGALDDSQRASTMAVFRVLLNVLVITLLPLAGHLSESYAWLLAVLMLVVW